MSIKDDFKSYIDGNGLNTPNLGNWTNDQFGSDNGPMYTSEMYIAIKKNNEITEQDKLDYNQKILECITSDGLLNRVPLGQEDGQDGPDDFYGVLNCCIELENTYIPGRLLSGCIKYLGFLNNENPGIKTLQSFLIRQPQLLAAIINSSFPSMLNPLHWLIRLLSFPLYLVAAVSIFISCTGTNIQDTDSRRLSWHLQNNMKKTSLMCKLASIFWLKRLKKDYSNEMKDVAAIYYSPKGLNNNPYSKWWIT